MKISVIIPAYNSENTIINAITSVDNQKIDNYVNIEIIIIDDGSKDNTLSLAMNYKTKSPLVTIKIYTKLNGGVSSARNYGIHRATGEWIAFLDSDDEWLPHKLQTQLNIVIQNPNMDFIGCARNNEILKIRGKKINAIYKVSVNDLLIKMFPQTSTALVKKTVLDNIGYYNEEMTHAEDGELWIRICKNGGFYYLPASLVITGNGKKNYGESGLSADLKKMQDGVMLILDICYSNNTISSWYKYQAFRLFYKLKYLRRLFLAKVKLS